MSGLILTSSNMADHIVSIEDAREDLLSCAVYLAESIGSSDARAAAIETIISYYLQRSDVDTSAEIADSVEDPFIRDRLLAEVVSKCAEIGDDEYSFQLVDAIDEQSTKNSALGKIAIQKAKKYQFDEAIALAEKLDHSSDVFAGISIYQAASGAVLEAEKTLDRVDFFSAKVVALQEIALLQLRKSATENAVTTLDRAFSIAGDIEFTEDKIRALLAIAGSYREAGESEKSCVTLVSARGVVEAIDGAHKDNFFVNIAIGFLRSENVDEADSTLDLVEDKAQIADCLIGFTQVFRLAEENDEALESLEEAFAMLKSQTEREIRNTKVRLQLFGTVAKEFAELGELERAIEIAHENPDGEIKNLALSQIAQICTVQNNAGMAKTAINGIEPESQRIPAIIAVSDVLVKEKRQEEALEKLNEASDMARDIQQYIFRCELQNQIAKRLHEVGDAGASRRILSEALESAKEIRGGAHRSVALAELSETYEQFEFDLSPEDKEIISTLVRTSDW